MASPAPTLLTTEPGTLQCTLCHCVIPQTRPTGTTCTSQGFSQQRCATNHIIQTSPEKLSTLQIQPIALNTVTKFAKCAYQRGVAVLLQHTTTHQWWSIQATMLVFRSITVSLEEVGMTREQLQPLHMDINSVEPSRSALPVFVRVVDNSNGSQVASLVASQRTVRNLFLISPLLARRFVQVCNIACKAKHNIMTIPIRPVKHVVHVRTSSRGIKRTRLGEAVSLKQRSH